METHMRIGVPLNEPQGPEALSELRDQLRRAADEGFASAWMSQLFGLDTLTALATAGSGVAGIEVGTAVVPIYPRHPAVLAQQALTVAAALGDRLTLGIGLSHKFVVEDMYGYSYDRPVRHMREYLSVLLPLLAGEQADFKGATVSCDIRLSASRERRMPVMLAALGPQMLHLAGERVDGTITWMAGPVTLRDHIVPLINAGARDAGREAPRVVCLLPICVTDEPENARARASEAFALYNDLPSYRAMLDLEGAAGPSDVVIVGDEDSVAGQVMALAEAGATDFVGIEFSGGSEAQRTRALLKSLLTR
jgi:5,10-methylenetetrahydromethanopterin reductase